MKTPSGLFKDLCRVGVKCVFTANWCPVPVVRTVMQVKSRSVGFSHPTKAGTVSWIDFPTNEEVKSPELGLFHIQHIGFQDAVLAYDFRPESVRALEAPVMATPKGWDAV